MSRRCGRKGKRLATWTSLSRGIPTGSALRFLEGRDCPIRSHRAHRFCRRGFFFFFLGHVMVTVFFFVVNTGRASQSSVQALFRKRPQRHVSGLFLHHLTSTVT